MLSLSGQHTGRTDLPLTAAGEAHAVDMGRSLAGRPFALVLTSPLQRARENVPARKATAMQPKSSPT